PGEERFEQQDEQAKEKELSPHFGAVSGLADHTGKIVLAGEHGLDRQALESVGKGALIQERHVRLGGVEIDGQGLGGFASLQFVKSELVGGLEFNGCAVADGGGLERDIGVGGSL